MWTRDLVRRQVRRERSATYEDALVCYEPARRLAVVVREDRDADGRRVVHFSVSRAGQRVSDPELHQLCEKFFGASCEFVEPFSVYPATRHLLHYPDECEVGTGLGLGDVCRRAAA
jgi:hypothetical protein